MTTTIPTLGQFWPEQGGIYIGARIVNGEVHHIITPAGTDHDQKSDFYKIEKNEIQFGEINGHSDWQVGEQEDLMLGYINARDQFQQTGGLDSIYWSRSFHHDWPWAVDFEGGNVGSGDHYDTFRVRPFRSVVHSTL